MDLVPDDLPDLPHPATHGGGDLVGDDLPDLPDPNAPHDHKIEDRLGKGIAQRAAREAPPADDELSLGEALSQGAHNLIPSAKENVKAFGDVIVHPRETLDAFKQLGTGLGSKMEGAVVGGQDPVKKASDERVINALMDHYKDVYGSAKGFKKELAKDPTSILMDWSPVVSGGLGVAARAAGTATKAGKALSVARHLTDPVSATLYGAGKVAGGVNAFGRAVASKTANVPKSALDIANAAGAETDPALRDVFKRHLHGEGDAREVLDTAQDALKKARAGYSSEYAQSAAGHAASQQPVTATHINNIEQAISDVRSKMNGPGRLTGGFGNRNKMLDQIEGLVDSFKNDPRYHNYEGLDILKRAIRDKQYDEFKYHSHSEGGHDASEIANAVKAQIEDIAPGYNKTMENWETALNNVRDLTSGLGIGANADATRAVSRMLKQMQNDNGQQLLSRLDEHRKDLKYMLAGHTLHPWGHGGLRGIFDLLVSAGGISGMLHPGAAAYWAGASPRIMGSAQYGFGAASRAAGSLPAQAGKYGAMQLSHIEPRDDQIDAQAPTPKTPSTAEEPLPSPTQKSADSVGIRNNNPGNIKDSDWSRGLQGYAGTDGTFAQFKTPEDGEAAAKRLLRNKIASGADTIEKVAKAWLGNNPDPKELADKIRNMARVAGHNASARFDVRSLDNIWNALKVSEVGPGHAAGGRIRRASGGRTIDHAGEAAKLLAVVDKRLKHQNKTTEPLLEMHDDAVTKALRAADKYI